MFQSHIVLTQTFVESNKLAKVIAYNFAQNGNIEKSIDLVNSKLNVSKEDLDRNWQKMLSSSRVIEKNYTKKEEFTKNLLSLYEVYAEPVLLFLGDLSKYSLPLQEGMLKLLEEPPRNLYVILYSRNKSQILSTISSRCRFHFLKKDTIIHNFLDLGLLEKTKKLLPAPAEFVQDYLKGSVDFTSIDLKKVEREELSFWFWQIATYLEQVYKSNPNKQLAVKIEKLLEAQKLNTENLQKKFTLNWLE